jgi:K+-transporting ATPase KdpF subunit
MDSIILIGTIQTSEMIKASEGYIIGAIIAMLILGYLFYSLIKPEKF